MKAFDLAFHKWDWAVGYCGSFPARRRVPRRAWVWVCERGLGHFKEEKKKKERQIVTHQNVIPLGYNYNSCLASRN